MIVLSFSIGSNFPLPSSPSSAELQREVLSKAFSKEVQCLHGDDFWEKLKNGAETFGENEKGGYERAAKRIVGKIDYARHKYNFLDAGASVGNPLYYIENGKVNVINLGEFNEAQANVAVSFYLEELLEDRKKATIQQKNEMFQPLDKSNSSYTKTLFPKPILVVIEEAHVFIPKYENTNTKHLAAKVAREGRKFGLG